MKSDLTTTPCPSCLKSSIRREAVQRLPKGALAPLLVKTRRPCCYDCASADTLMRIMPEMPSWDAARIAVANDRQEQYRFPGVPLGLVGQGYVRASEDGDFQDQLAWLDTQPWWSGTWQPHEG